MASPGKIDLVVSFPDPVTGRGTAVNTLTLEVMNMFGVVVDTYTLSTPGLVAEQTILSGVLYTVYDYDITDSVKTPGTALTLRYSATKGTEPVISQTRVVSFRPATKDTTNGVLVEWTGDPEAIASYDRGDLDILFYEVRRIDERATGSTFVPSFTPNQYTLAYWSLNGDTVDRTTPAANLTLVNGRFITEGTQVDPVRFEGNGYAWTGHAKLSIPAAQDFSMSILLRLGSWGHTGFVMGKMGDKGTKGYGIWVESVNNEHYPSFYIGDGTNQILFASTSPLVRGRYYNLCVTIDRDGDALLYVDGVRQAGANVSPVMSAVFDSSDFRIGAQDDTEPDYLYGDVGHGIMFNGVLTPLDVTELFNGMLGDSSEQILGRTLNNQFLDVDIVDPFQMRHYLWRVYRAVHVATGGIDGTDYRLEKIHQFNYKQVKTVAAPLCQVSGRIREPNDLFPSESYVKFYVAYRDRGQFVHGRYVGDDEIYAFPDTTGQFSAYLIQDSVIVCHMPEAHLALRFAVPRQDTARLEDIETERIQLRNNI